MYGFWKDKLESNKNLTKLDKVTAQMRRFYKNSEKLSIHEFFAKYDEYVTYRNGILKDAHTMQQNAAELDTKNNTRKILPLIHNLSFRGSEDNKEFAQCHFDALTVSMEIEQEWKHRYEKMAKMLSVIHKYVYNKLSSMRSRKIANEVKLTSDFANDAVALNYEVGIRYFEVWNRLYNAISVELSDIVERVEKKLAKDAKRIETISEVLVKIENAQTSEKTQTSEKALSPEKAQTSEKKQSPLATTQILPLQKTLSRSLQSTKNLLLPQQKVVQKSKSRNLSIPGLATERGNYTMNPLIQMQEEVQSKSPSAKKTRRNWNWIPKFFRASRKNDRKNDRENAYLVD